MDALKTYIDNVFMALPENEMTRELKAELLKSSEEKYIGLLKQGKNENEALEIVIEEFGDISDLANELGYRTLTPLSEEEANERKAIVYQYSSFRKKFAWMIAGGVGLIFFGIIIAAFFGDADVPSWVSVASFFVKLALAIGIL